MSRYKRQFDFECVRSLNYLRTWARELKVTDFLERAIGEAS